MKPRVTVRDCCAFDPQPNEEERTWLVALARGFRAGELVVPLSDDPRDDEPDDYLVYCDKDGTWRAGRYIGEVTFQKRTLTIEPRMGMPVLEEMFAEATSAVIADVRGTAAAGKPFMVRAC